MLTVKTNSNFSPQYKFFYKVLLLFTLVIRVHALMLSHFSAHVRQLLDFKNVLRKKIIKKVIYPFFRYKSQRNWDTLVSRCVLYNSGLFCRRKRIFMVAMLTVSFSYHTNYVMPCLCTLFIAIINKFNHKIQ